MADRWRNLRGSFYNGNFCEYEWNKHGKCAIGAPGVGNLAEYFSKTIEIANNFNMKEILRLGHTHEGQQTNTRIIEDAFGNHVPNVKYSHVQNEDWLLEIHVCLSKTTFAVINCHQQGLKHLYYPPYFQGPVVG